MRNLFLMAPIIVGVFAIPVDSLAQDKPTAKVLQGGIARWAGQDAAECGIYGKRFQAVQGICYYPVDMTTKPGVHEVALWNAAGEQKLGSLDVEERECTETEITLEKAEYIEVSEENRKRAATERANIVKAVNGEAEVHPRFSLPLAGPAPGAGTKDRSDFCERRTYNDKIKSRHTGLDYLIGTGTAVTAPADGTVVLAEDQFYSGNTVLVDHGGGLVTMVFHLSDMAVEKGAQVKRGDKLGSVGESGRATGPHLHFGARWQAQRIDAGALLGDPARLPGIGEPEVGGTAPDVDAVEADTKAPAAEDRAGEDDNSAVKDD
jgi:murein DD-endopeptidase MepM/ murein hydrolase activator NlpD